MGNNQQFEKNMSKVVNVAVAVIHLTINIYWDFAMPVNTKAIAMSLSGEKLSQMKPQNKG